MNTAGKAATFMTDAVVTHSQGYPVRASAFDTIMWGGLAAGVLDAIDALIAFAIKGRNPIQVLQYIASGVLGTQSFQGGLTTAALGAGFHFLIAFVAAAVYYGATIKMSTLLKRPIQWGLIFGAAVYFFMNYVVLPLSNAAPRGFSLPMFLNGVIGHAIFVGLPIALFAKRSTQSR